MLFHSLFRSLIPLKHHYALFFPSKMFVFLQHFQHSGDISAQIGTLLGQNVHGAFYLISVCSINLDSSKRIDACAIIRTSISLMESILLPNPQPISYIF